MRGLISTLFLRPLLFLLHWTGAYDWWCRKNQARAAKCERKFLQGTTVHRLPKHTSIAVALGWRLANREGLYWPDPWYAFGDYWASPNRVELALKLKAKNPELPWTDAAAIKLWLAAEGLDCDDWAAYVFEVLRLEPDGWSAHRPLLFEVIWWDGWRLRGHHVCGFLTRNSAILSAGIVCNWWHAGNWGVQGPFTDLRGLINSIVGDGKLVAAYASPSFPGTDFDNADTVVDTYWRPATEDWGIAP